MLILQRIRNHLNLGAKKYFCIIFLRNAGVLIRFFYFYESVEQNFSITI
jgi:hypothetical protein